MDDLQDASPFGQVPIEVTISVGKARPLVRDLLRLSRDAVLALDRRVDDPVELYVGDRLIAKRNHLAELPRRIDVQQRKRQLAGIECLQGKVEHHARILADRIEHHRLFAFGRHLADDVNALGLKPLARIVSSGTFAQEPVKFTTAPVEAMRRAMKRMSSPA